MLESDSDEQIALTFSARDVIAPKGNVLMRRGYPAAKKEGRSDSPIVLRACVRRGTNLIGEPRAVLFRKSLVEIISAFDDTNLYVIDLDCWFRLLAHGDALGTVQSPWLHSAFQRNTRVLF